MRCEPSASARCTSFSIRTTQCAASISRQSTIYKTCPHLDSSEYNPKCCKHLFRKTKLFLLVAVHGQPFGISLRKTHVFILFRIHLVAPNVFLRLPRFSKLVAHCTGRWIAQRRKRLRMRGRWKEGSMQSMHYAGERAGELVCVEILDLNREQSSINSDKYRATQAIYRYNSQLLFLNPSFYEQYLKCKWRCFISLMRVSIFMFSRCATQCV